MVVIRTATGLIAAYMRICGFKGWTSFWRVIYVLPGHERDERLLRHERHHLEQIDDRTHCVRPRDGWVAVSIQPIVA